MRSALFIGSVIGAVLLGGTMAQAQQSSKPNPLDVVPDKMAYNIPYGTPIGADEARQLIAAAVAEAKKHDWALNIAVLDSGSNLVAFERMDGAQLASIEISQNKARTAVGFRRETKIFEGAVQNGSNQVLSLGVTASRGGIPLIKDGKLIGAIGCSGGTGSQDEVACKAAVALLNK